LTDRQRELVILTVASEVRSHYEWHQHVAIARELGVDDREIEAIARDDRTPFSELECLLVAYARAVTRGRVTDSLHKAMAECFDHSAIVGTAALASSYFALGHLIDALDIEIEVGDEFVGWDLSE
jgi:alkylhydroperoxidase family enzyme